MIVTEQIDLNVATQNKAEVDQLIQTARTTKAVAKLPAGKIHLNTALDFTQGNFVLEGTGNQDTVLRNSFFSGTYPQNCSVFAYGDGKVGFNDAVANINRKEMSVTLGSNWANISTYKVGTAVYLAIYDSYFNNPQTIYERFTIKSVDLLAKKFFVNEKIPDVAYTVSFWSNGYQIADVSKSAIIKLIDKTKTSQFTVGMNVCVSNGPQVANEMLCEHRRVVAVDPIAGTVEMDRPVFRTYNKGCLVADVRRAQNITLRNLVIDQPVHSGSNSLYFGTTANVVFENVRFGLDMPTQGFGFANSENILLKNCFSQYSLGFNDTINSTVMDSTFNGIIMEERSSGIRILNVSLSGYASRIAHGICVSTGSDNVIVDNVTIENFGYNGYSPIAAGLSNSLLSNVKIINCVAASWIGGDNIKITNFISDADVYIQSGRNICLVGFDAPFLSLGWNENGWKTSGILISNCNRKIYQGSVWNEVKTPAILPGPLTTAKTGGLLNKIQNMIMGR